ncbi:MAG: histidinol-phosphatase, partial [Actinomycetota bacterium]|nr:histidinol-phosphatase [Actinomycetota bacterium]
MAVAPLVASSGYRGRVPVYDDDLRLAHVLADAVERITMARFRAEDLVVESKPDLSLVSDADKAAEEAV